LGDAKAWRTEEDKIISHEEACHIVDCQEIIIESDRYPKHEPSKCHTEL
jgi:hypothetical protein